MFKNYKIKKFKIFSLVCLFFVAVINLSAEEIDTSKIVDQRAQLEAQLAEIEQQMQGYENLIAGKQRESTTLERDIAIFDAQIDKAKLGIKASNIAIAELESSIKDKTSAISVYELKINDEKISLSELLRRVNELDSNNLVNIILGYSTLSDFFADFSSFESIQKELQASLVEIEDSRQKTSDEKLSLEDKRIERLQLRDLQDLEKKNLEKKEAEKNALLKATRGQEDVYQKILKARQKDAAAIRSQLFVLRGSAAIPFEKAVEYANFAFQKTGVRQAFLLGVIAEESNLGENVGTGNWKEDLAHPNCQKQRVAFLEITSELGLNPDVLPVSKKVWYGYCGGAMGPAQFMPSTWLLYKDSIASLTGHNPPNPWEPLDAFTASALLLKDNGAAAGGYTAERRAALRYLAGGNWSKPAYAFYGDDVMALASKYQEQINIISQ